MAPSKPSIPTRTNKTDSEGHAILAHSLKRTLRGEPTRETREGRTIRRDLVQQGYELSRSGAVWLSGAHYLREIFVSKRSQQVVDSLAHNALPDELILMVMECLVRGKAPVTRVFPNKPIALDVVCYDLLGGSPASKQLQPQLQEALFKESIFSLEFGPWDVAAAVDFILNPPHPIRQLQLDPGAIPLRYGNLPSRLRRRLMRQVIGYFKWPTAVLRGLTNIAPVPARLQALQHVKSLSSRCHFSISCSMADFSANGWYTSNDFRPGLSPQDLIIEFAHAFHAMHSFSGQKCLHVITEKTNEYQREIKEVVVDALTEVEEIERAVATSVI